MQKINDAVLFRSLDLNKNSTFKELIEKISKHVYEDIRLDSVFDIKKWLERLLECEIFLSTTKKRHRDHLLHACRIALFGEMILNYRIGKKSKFENYYLDESHINNKKQFIQRLKIANDPISFHINTIMDDDLKDKLNICQSDEDIDALIKLIVPYLNKLLDEEDFYYKIHNSLDGMLAKSFKLSSKNISQENYFICLNRLILEDYYRENILKLEFGSPLLSLVDIKYPLRFILKLIKKEGPACEIIYGKFSASFKSELIDYETMIKECKSSSLQQSILEQLKSELGNLKAYEDLSEPELEDALINLKEIDSTMDDSACCFNEKEGPVTSPHCFTAEFYQNLERYYNSISPSEKLKEHLVKELNIIMAYPSIIIDKQYLGNSTINKRIEHLERDKKWYISRFNRLLIEEYFSSEINPSEFKLIDLVRDLMIENKKFQKLMALYEIDKNNKKLLNEKIMQAWYISSLFHDVGYIYEAFTESWKSMQIFKEFPNFKDFYLDIESSITKFQNNLAISPLIRNKIKPEFISEFDHGNIGASLISNLLYDSNFICDIAAAITNSHTSNDVIDFTKDPLSFLLILLDEIQEWERPVLGKKLRDQALSEEIEKYSPYIDHICAKPELCNISLSIGSFEAKKHKKLQLRLIFNLNFGSDVDIIDKTNFSYPMMLYIKYRNLQRLRINKTELIDGILKRYGYGDNLKSDFIVSLKIKSENPLSQLWDRQCNILMIKALRNNNSVISGWLANSIRYRDLKGQAKFRIGKEYLPRIFCGEFGKLIQDAHDTYLRDSYICENECTMVTTFSHINNDIAILGNSKITRKLVSIRRDMPISGFYICFDENIIENSLTINSVKVNGKSITEEAIKHFYQLPIEKIKERKDPFRENYAMYIPFSIPLSDFEEKKIEIDFTFKTYFEKLSYYDAIYNGRKRKAMTNANLTVRWDKELFKEKFKSGVTFKGENKKVNSLLKRLKKNNDISSLFDEFPGFIIARFEPFQEEDNYYVFKIPDASIDPYNLIGFAWVKKP